MSGPTPRSGSSATRSSRSSRDSRRGSARCESRLTFANQRGYHACMSSFELSREHEEFRQSVREFAQAQIAPYCAQWDRDHHFPVDVVQEMGKLGLFGLTSPEEY